MSNMVNLRISIPRELHDMVKAVTPRYGDKKELYIKGIRWAVADELKKQKILADHGYTTN